MADLSLEITSQLCYTEYRGMLSMEQAERLYHIRHPDGRTELVVRDTTVELIAQEFDDIGLKLPLTVSDEEAICDHFQSMDADIGGMEMKGIRATPEFDEQVCVAVDEFMDSAVSYIDYDALTNRVRPVLQKILDGTYEPIVKRRWVEPDA